MLLEQLLVDRALPDIVVGERTRLAAAASETRSDAEIAVDNAVQEETSDSRTIGTSSHLRSKTIGEGA